MSKFRFGALSRSKQDPKGVTNVLLILLDDVGFGQFSVAGVGVPSPKMEEPAQRGGTLHPIPHRCGMRATRLTERNHQVARAGNITEVATGYDGSTGITPKDTATVAEILRQNGYINVWFGKNHNTPIYETTPMGSFDHWPNGR